MLKYSENAITLDNRVLVSFDPRQAVCKRSWNPKWGTPNVRINSLRNNIYIIYRTRDHTFDIYINRIKYYGNYLDPIGDFNIPDIVVEYIYKFTFDISFDKFSGETPPQEFDDELIKLSKLMQYAYDVAIDHTYVIDDYIGLNDESISGDMLISIKRLSSGIISINGIEYKVVINDPVIATCPQMIANIVITMRNEIIMDAKLPISLKSAHRACRPETAN